MQITFSREQVYVPEWRGNNELPEGEQFSVKMVLLNVEDLMFLLDSFSEAGIQGETEADAVGTEQIKPILKSNGHLLPKYVTISNLKNTETDADLTIEDIVEFPFFLNLAAELLMKLADASSPSDEDVKNSNALPASEQTQEAPST